MCTLERHFSSIDSNNIKNDLESLNEPITNLITHLKLIWMNTKHFHKDIARFKNLMEAIANEINTKVRNIIRNWFRDINENNLDLMSLMIEIDHGKKVIITFKEKYTLTKKDVKDENSEFSWDDSNDLFNESDITINRLTHLWERLELLEQLNGLIDNELTQVIGDANFLKDSKEAIIEM